MRFVSADDVAQIDHRSLFLGHVTRHLSRLSDDAQKALHEVGFSDEIIQGFLATHGSKFNAKIDDPRVLIDFAKSKLTELVSSKKIPWILRYNKSKEIAQAEVKLSSSDKSKLGLSKGDSLGSASVIEITDKIAHLVKVELRGQADAHDEVEINVIEGYPVPTTDNLVITLHRDPATRQLTAFSAYSGVPAVGLPAPSDQSEEELAESRAYWAKHAFLR